MYVADSEARLRREFEEKGLSRPRRSSRPDAARSPASICRRCRTRRKVPSREFLVFNQELATLLKAGHAARAVARHPAPARHRTRPSRPCSTTSTSGCGRAARCRRRSRRTARCFRASTRRRCWPARSRGNLEQVLRRYVDLREGRVERAAQDDLGAGLSRRSSSLLSLVVVTVIVVQGRAGVRRLLQPVRQGAAAVDPDHRRRSRSSLTTYFVLIFGGDRGGDRGRAVVWLRQPGQRRRLDRLILQAADARADRAEVLDLAGRADAGDAARRRHSAGQRARGHGAVARQPAHGARSCTTRGAAGARRAVARRRAAATAARFPTSRSRWWRSASRPARCRRC